MIEFWRDGSASFNIIHISFDAAKGSNKNVFDEKSRSEGDFGKLISRAFQLSSRSQ